MIDAPAANLEKRIRSFIAIELPDGLKTELAALQALLRPFGGNAVKWVEPSGMHITLKFLGGVAETQLCDIKQRLAQLAGIFKPFTLTADGVGAFPCPARAQVIWCGLVGDTAKLNRLQQAVEAAISPLGFPAEKRPFAPHLTLSRSKDDASPEARRRLGEAALSLGFSSTCTIEVDSVSLMKSELSSRGASYSSLGHFELSGRA